MRARASFSLRSEETTPLRLRKAASWARFSVMLVPSRSTSARRSAIAPLEAVSWADGAVSGVSPLGA